MRYCKVSGIAGRGFPGDPGSCTFEMTHDRYCNRTDIWASILMLKWHGIAKSRESAKLQQTLQVRGANRTGG